MAKLMLKVKRLDPNAKIPSYAHPDDAGLDLYSIENYTLKSVERKVIRTGIAIELPKKFVGLIWEKGGISAKYGIIVLAGVIDSNYRGEVGVVLFNSSKKPYKIIKGEKIAQLLVQPIVNCKIKEVQNLSSTSRGEKSYGSSGRK